MARQLTLIDYDLLSRITAKEWLAHNEWATNKAKKRDDESKPAAPNLVAMINHFNCVCQPPPRPAPNVACRLACVVCRVSCVVCRVSCAVCRVPCAVVPCSVGTQVSKWVATEIVKCAKIKHRVLLTKKFIEVAQVPLPSQSPRGNSVTEC
jgi:hypothetical protein